MIKAGLVVACALGVGSGVAHAGGGAGILIPPVELDIGGTTPLIGGEAAGPSMDLLVGLHWASLAWRPTSFDIGCGYVASFRSLLPGYMPGAGGAIERSPTPPAVTADSFALHGVYLTLGHSLVRQPHFRTWLEVRGELSEGKLADRWISVAGGAVRFAAELYTSGAKAGGDRNALGVVVGTFAVGLYIEASHRTIPTELGATGLTTGISVRVPFVLAGAG